MSENPDQVAKRAVKFGKSFSNAESLQEKLDEQKELNKQLQAKLKSLSEQFETFKASCCKDHPDIDRDQVSLVEELNQYKQEVAACHERIAQLEQAVSNLPQSDDSNFEFENSTAAKNEELVELVERKSKEIERQEGELRGLRERLDEVRTELTELRNHYDAVQCDNMTYQMQIQKLETIASNSDKEIESLKNSLSSLEEACESITNERDSIAEQCEQLEEEKLSLSQQLEDAHSQLQERESLESKIDELSIRNTDLEEQLQAMQDEIEASNQEMRIKERHESDAARRINELKDKITQIKMKVNTISAENEDLRQELSHKIAESEFESHKAALELKNLTGQIEVLREENERLKSNSESACMSMRDELTESRRNNDYLLSKIKTLQRWHVKGTTESTEMVQQLRSENTFLKATNRNLRKENDELRQSQDDQMRLSAFESEENSSLIEENKSLKAKVRKLTLENEDLSLQADRSIEIINSLKMENEDLNESLSQSQRALSEAYRASGAHESLLDDVGSEDFSDITEEDIDEPIPRVPRSPKHPQSSAERRHNEDVLGKLRQAIDRLERLKDTKPTRK